MNCPRCIDSRDGEVSPYRGHVRVPTTVRLLPETSADAGLEIARCGSCRGAFAEHHALVAIENAGRRLRRGVFARDEARHAVRRAYDAPTPPIRCPSCSGETTRREWSIGTLVFVDVCVECRGVWLDAGELETLGG